MTSKIKPIDKKIVDSQKGNLIVFTARGLGDFLKDDMLVLVYSKSGISYFAGYNVRQALESNQDSPILVPIKPSILNETEHKRVMMFRKENTLADPDYESIIKISEEVQRRGKGGVLVAVRNASDLELMADPFLLKELSFEVKPTIQVSPPPKPTERDTQPQKKESLEKGFEYLVTSQILGLTDKALRYIGISYEKNGLPAHIFAQKVNNPLLKDEFLAYEIPDSCLIRVNPDQRKYGIAEIGSRVFWLSDKNNGESRKKFYQRVKKAFSS